MIHKASMKRRSLTFLAVVALGMLTSACGPVLQEVGYAAPNKVWYHWVAGADAHLLVVCDVQADGSEANCRESEI